MFFCLILLTFNLFNASSQIVDFDTNHDPAPRLRKGVKSALKKNNCKSLFLTAGISGKGYFGKIGSSILLNEKFYVNADFMYEKAKAYVFEFSTYNFSATLLGSPLRPLRNIVYINGGVGICGNISSIKDVSLDEGLNPSNLNTMDLGPLIALETETFLTRKLAWIFSADQRWFITNNFAKTKRRKSVNTFFVSTGFKLFI